MSRALCFGEMVQGGETFDTRHRYSPRADVRSRSLFRLGPMSRRPSTPSLVRADRPVGGPSAPAGLYPPPVFRARRHSCRPGVSLRPPAVPTAPWRRLRFVPARDIRPLQVHLISETCVPNARMRATPGNRATFLPQTLFSKSIYFGEEACQRGEPRAVDIAISPRN